MRSYRSTAGVALLAATGVVAIAASFLFIDETRDETHERLDLPGLAPVAMQQGRYVARVIKARLEGRPHEPFHYIDKGNLATIGRARAVAEIKKLGCEIISDAGVIPVKFRAPGGTVAEIVPEKRYKKPGHRKTK